MKRSGAPGECHPCHPVNLVDNTESARKLKQEKIIDRVIIFNFHLMLIS